MARRAASSRHFTGMDAPKGLARPLSENSSPVTGPKIPKERVIDRKDLPVLVQDRNGASDRPQDAVHDRVHAGDLHRLLQFGRRGTLRRCKICRQMEIYDAAPCSHDRDR